MKSKIIMIGIFIALLVITIVFAINVNEEQETKFNIVTSFYPMYIATLNITDGIDDISVKNLTSDMGGCIHDYVLSTTELVTLAKADVLVINGAGMEGFMDKVISNFSELDIIDASNGIDVIHNECDEEHHSHEGHNHEINTHIFVSVKNYIKQVQNICDRLVEIDSVNTDKYKQNTDAYIANLQELEQEIENTLSTINSRNIVTFHNTFDYFAKDYGLNVIGTIENEHGKNPSAGEIAELVGRIKRNNVRAIFVEPEYSVKIVDAIAKETGAKAYTLNPVTSGENKKNEYINIMRENLNVLKEALK
ncbi:MAG: zinc ABC transporter substrate-binding protein [Clostridia bacterium]|nr:zinc ABC transporter substrate-binding protein [Clostridia bacterium]